ncbi:MAG: PD-(D/E)XK nuclease family protein [Patescibacteria group bacterium]
MSEYYNSRRIRNLFNPESREPFSISRSKIDLFLECPFCFYTDRRLGVGRPPGFPFTLNVAVDKLLKKEFDIYRAEGVPHPLMAEYKILAKPFKHGDLDKWRENFVGMQYLHKPTNLKITGAIDDVWINDKKELHVVDYKATSKESEVTLDAPWQDGYKRQMEIYQWLLRQNGYKVSDTGYFVYCNGNTDKESFDGKLEFNIKIIPYRGKGDWIEKTILDLKNCLLLYVPPASGKECDYCNYREAVETVAPKKDKNNRSLF